MIARWRSFLLATLAVAVIAYFGTLLAAPRVIMMLAMSRLAGQTGGVNIPVSTNLPDASARNIVKPSPDLSYTLCVFDLAQGPVLVGGRPANAYWSLALYGANTDNFFVVNDRTAGKAGARFVLADAASRARIPAEFRSLEVIEPPSARGIMLQRYLVLDAADLAAAKAAQADAVCRAL